MIKKIRIITAGFCIAMVANVANAAVTYPYTGAIKYPYGLESIKLTEKDFQGIYSKYKASDCLKTCNGGWRTTCVGENNDGGVVMQQKLNQWDGLPLWLRIWVIRLSMMDL